MPVRSNRTPGARPGPRRNKGFDDTHRELIETAVRLISEKGVDALSVAALSREMGINRTTVYYHFDSREALLHAVTSWASDELAHGMDMGVPIPERIGNISRFVLSNPELFKLWIDDFISGTDIRDSYPRWDELVEGVRERFASELPGEEIDAEIYCVMMLTAAFIGPRVYAASVNRKASIETVVELFRKEQERAARRDRLLTGEEEDGEPGPQSGLT